MTLEIRQHGRVGAEILGVDLSRQSNDKLIYAYILPPGFTTRQAIPRPLVNPDPNFPAGYSVFRAVPGRNITCPASGNCTTLVDGVTRRIDWPTTRLIASMS